MSLLTFKVVLLGDSGVGKSSLLHRYFENEFLDNHHATIGVDYKCKEIQIREKTQIQEDQMSPANETQQQHSNVKAVNLQIWDTAGQEKFRNITSSYYRNVHCFILMFDITNKESFDNLEYWYNDIQKFKTIESLIILIGTKKDKRDERTVYIDTIQKFAKDKDKDFKYFETSSKNNDGIYYIFNYIADILADKFPNNILETKKKESNHIVLTIDNDPKDDNYKNYEYYKQCCF